MRASDILRRTLILLFVAWSRVASADQCTLECQRWLPPWPCASAEVWCSGNLWCTNGSCGEFQATFVCWNSDNHGTWSGMLDCGYNPGWLTGQSRAAITESSARAPYWRVVYRPTANGAVAVVASDESILSRLQPKDLELPADHDLKLSLCPGTSSTPPPSGRLLQTTRASVPKELGRGFLVAEVRSEGARPTLKPLAGDSTTGLAAALGPLAERIGSAGVAPEANWLFAKWNDGALDLVLAVFAAGPNGGEN